MALHLGSSKQIFLHSSSPPFTLPASTDSSWVTSRAGVPDKTAQHVTQLRDNRFIERHVCDHLISRFVPVNWPPRSCDFLTPLDYFLWGYVKSLVYADKPQTLDHLKTTFAVLLPIRPNCWKKSSKIDVQIGLHPEPAAVAVICQKSYLKCNAIRLSFE
ncbi:uncharacterized protein TNCV_187671 [Trichonephila clavipes]|nr:uncharacterized protein TNCV_187671 [Trichonephila clavipes]